MDEYIDKSKTELDKCMAGEYYDCHDKIFLEFKNTTRKLLKDYHALAYDQKEEKRKEYERCKEKSLKGIIWGNRYKCVCGTALYL